MTTLEYIEAKRNFLNSLENLLDTMANGITEPAADEDTSIEASEGVYLPSESNTPTLTPPEGFEGSEWPQSEKRNQWVEQSAKEILDRNPTLLDTPFIDAMREKYRTHWQQEELVTLLDLVMEGKSLKEMAVILKRDMDGIKKQLWKLGYSVVNGQVSKSIEYSA